MTYLLPIISQDIAAAEALLSDSRTFFQELLIKATMKFRNHGEPPIPEKSYQWDFPAVYATLEALRDTTLSDIQEVISHLKRLRAQAGCSKESWLCGQVLAQRTKLALVNPTVGARRSYLEAMNFGVLEFFLDALCTPLKVAAPANPAATSSAAGTGPDLLVRPHRFDTRVEVGLPDRHTREHVFLTVRGPGDAKSVFKFPETTFGWLFGEPTDEEHQ